MTEKRLTSRHSRSKRGGYTTDKKVSVSKLPKGPGPGAATSPKSAKSK